MPIKHVFDQIVSFENILQAEQDVRRGSRYGIEELTFWRNYEDNLHAIADALKGLRFPPDTYRAFFIYEPKLRMIICTDYVTKIIQRAVYNVVNPLICRGFITDTYSCVKGRGQLHAMERLAGWVDHVTAGGGNWYYLKLDVEKFFYRIDHGILMDIIREKVKDRKAVRIMEHYVCEASQPFGLPLGVKNPMDIPREEMLYGVGITIGGGLSHMYGNMYLDRLDQHAKRELGVRYYIRYMDDIVVLSDSKAELHELREDFGRFLEDRMRLRLNGKTAIRPVNQGMEFVGFRIRPGRVELRKSTALRMKRHLKDVQGKYRDSLITFEKANQTVQSYLSIMGKCDCMALRRNVFGGLVFTHGQMEACG